MRLTEKDCAGDVDGVGETDDGDDDDENDDGVGKTVQKM